MSSNPELAGTKVTLKPDYPILFLLSLGHLAADINQGALPVILPRLFTDYGLSYTLTGTIMMVFSFSSSIIQPIFGFLSDKKSTLWILPIGVLLASFCMALLGYVPSFALILFFALMSGIGVAAYHPQGSKAANFASGTARASAMSIFSVGGNLGYGLGAAIMAVFLAASGIKGTAYLAIPGLLAAILLWANLAKIPSRPRPQDHREKVGDSIRSSRNTLWLPLSLLILIIILRSFIQAGLVTFIPLYLVTYLGESESYSNTLISIFLLAGAFGTAIGGPLADRYGKTKLLEWSMALMSPLILLFLYGPAWLSVISLTLTGAVLISTFAVTVVLGQTFMPDSVGVASGLTLGFGVGTGGIGAVILGMIADTWGMNVTMLTIAFLPVIGFLITIIFIAIQRKAFGHVS